MVYKRYIKKNGKRYGPYFYESHKKNGKVISKYIGREEIKKQGINFSFFKPLFFILGFIILLFLIIFFSNSIFTGKVTLLSEETYFPGEKINGTLKLVLKQGELIPISTIVIFDNAGDETAYILNELVSENKVQGNFFVENKEINGSGSGYGLNNSVEIYPEVFFTLRIFPESSDESEEEGVDEEVVNETKENEEEGVDEEVVNETKENEEEGVDEEVVNETKENEEENQTEESGEDDVVDEAEENQTEEAEDEEVISEPEEIEGAGVIKETEEVESEEDEVISEPEEIEEVEISPITGGVISEFNDIKGSVTTNNSFTYELNEGEIAEIIDSSEPVVINIENNIVTITTNYSEQLEGFGEDYLGDEEKEISINLSDLNLTAKQGTLLIYFIYQKEIIASVSKEISVEEIEEEINETLEEIINKTEIINETETFNETLIVNETENISFGLIKNIPDLEIKKNHKTILNLEDYFAGAEFYEFNKTENISFSINKSLLVIFPDNNFTGSRIAQIIGFRTIRKELVGEINDEIINETGELINQTEDNLVNETINQITSQITGNVINEEVNKTNDEIINQTLVIYYNETIKSNVFKIFVKDSNLNIQTIQYGAIIGKPVKWKKLVKKSVNENISLILPKGATNIRVKSVDKDNKGDKEFKNIEKDNFKISRMTGEIIAEIELEKDKGFLSKIFEFFSKITGFSVEDEIADNESVIVNITEKFVEDEIADNESVIVNITEKSPEIEVEYETPGPKAFEENTSNGKKIIISADDEYNYTNILAYTELPYEVKSGIAKLYWIKNVNQSILEENNSVQEICEFNNQTNLTECENITTTNETIIGYELVETKEIVNITEYDLDNNSLIDYIEWVVPHLSNQTYELIIEIYNAEHLDENRSLIQNIYEYVNETDNITYLIPQGDYVRAYFKDNLTDENIIDIYVYNTTNATIKVYEKDSEIVIGEIKNIFSGFYYIPLNYSNSNYIFDLKSDTSDVNYDYVHDGGDAPVTQSSRLYSETNTTSSDLQGYCNATDAEGDSLSYEYKWYNNSVVYLNGTCFKQGSISTGESHTCGIRANDSRVLCWGHGQSGRLGDGNTESHVVSNPTLTTDTSAYTSLSVGRQHVCGIRDNDSRILCWGIGGDGRLGDGNTESHVVSNPTLTTDSSAYLSVSCGYEHTCGIRKNDSRILCWGNGYEGRLGDGNTASHDVGNPNVTTDTSSYTSIDVGFYHICGIRTSDSRVLCWGKGDTGRLGDGSTTDHDVGNPNVITDTSGYSSIDCGNEHTCGIRANDSRVLCWGYGRNGRLGDGNIASHNVGNPNVTTDTSGYFSVISGMYHTCGIRKNDSRVLCWGFEYYGELGDGSLTPHNVAHPKVTTDMSAYTSLDTKFRHVCGIRTNDSRVLCWGKGIYGVLGDGNIALHKVSNPSVTTDTSEYASEFMQGKEQLISTLGSSFLLEGDDWLLSCRAYDGSLYSNWLNSSILSILDATFPDVAIISPLAQTYTHDSIWFNVSANDTIGMDSCWYNLDNGTNISMSNSSDIYYSQNTSMIDGDYTAYFFCNDTTGNINDAEQVSFSVDAVGPFPNKFEIKNSAGNNIAIIDEKGDLYLKETTFQSQGSLNPKANSFIIKNSASTNIAYFNNTGSLFLLGVISKSSDLSGRTSTNFEIRNSTNDLVAFFDNVGNLKLKGSLDEQSTWL